MKKNASARPVGVKPFPYEELLKAEAAQLLGQRGPLNLAVAAKDLITLQRGLTGDRALPGSLYLDEKKKLASYLLFYWPVSYAQTQAMLAMAGGQIAVAQPLRILDLGSGPAPCALAAADFFVAGAATEITACDQSPLALVSAGRLAREAGYQFHGLSGWNAARQPLPGNAELGPALFDVIIFGHMLNELWAKEEGRLEKRLALLEAAFARLAPSGVLLILEPALFTTGREAITLRDALTGRGYRVLAPCLHQAVCPALANPAHTCHSDFTWPVPPLVKELSRRTGLEKELLKTTAFVFTHPDATLATTELRPTVGPSAEPASGGATGKPPATPPAEYRVVSEAMLNKAGRVRFILCGPAGRLPLSAKKGEHFPAEATFFSLQRSDHIRLTQPVQRESGLALGPHTLIEKL